MYATTVTADPSSDATLSALELTDIPLVFDPATLDYAADVSHEVARTTVTATPNDEGATYRVTLDGDADEDGTIELTVGQNAIAVVVTAEDGATARTYTATVTRGAPPTAAVKLSPSSPVTSGTEITVTMTFANLEYDDDRSTTDYVFRADVAGADECENQAGGYGLGIDRYMHRVDEDPEVRRGTISAACPAGDYSVEVALTSPDGGESASASADFSVVEPAPAPTPTATAAVELSPSGPVTAGTEVAVAMSFAKLTFDSNTADTDYLFRADVVGADGCEGNGMGVERYMYKVDQDPEVRSSTISTGCPAGDYTLMVSIWSPDNTEPASASADFSVVEPAPEPEPDPPALSADATLSSLALSSVTLAFDSDTTTYTASVGNDVAETTVSPTPNHAGASYVVKLDGVADGSVVLAVGENAISVVVTAEDGETTVIYTVTLTRAEAPAPPEPKPTGPPGVPDQPVGQVSGKGQVRLEWNDVAGAGSYDVRYFDGQWMELPAGGISIVFDGSEAQISGLKDWGVHYFSVRAVNGAGASEWSEYNTMRNGG